ncbi:hypothetical protein IRB79_27350 (plasmid) [Cytobacillus oceanisediminis]|nr:hypothetical protein IRB79_27350 [Cytobacillus oceanisediminis]
MIILATRFLQDIKEFPVDAHGKITCEPRYKKEVIHDIGELLAGESVTAKEMGELFRKEKDNPNKALFYKPSSLLESKGIAIKRKPYREPDNLLVPGQFYFHPRLQATPPPPVLQIFDDGTFKASYDEEPFYLEIIDKITVRDLVDYFYAKFYSVCPDSHYSKDAGAFEHMLKFWDVDFILYLVDEAFACALDSGKELPKSPLDIQQYEAQAAAVYEARKNTCFEEGLDRVHPRTII